MKKVVLVALVLGLSLPAITSEKVIDMYKSGHCGHCSLWGKAMEKDGFKVRTHVMNDQTLSILKKKYSVPAGLRSRYTAAADKLVIGGHVSATMIHQAVQSDPGIYGLTTPGMPAGSPGMEMGDRREAYDIITSTPDESQNTFQRIK